jgi:hypothetical protein
MLDLIERALRSQSLSPIFGKNGMFTKNKNTA